MASLNRNFVKCAHVRCDEYVQCQSPKEMPLCSFHGTYDTTNQVTSEEMIEVYGTTEQAFYVRCDNLNERMVKLTARLKGERNNKEASQNETN